MSGTFPAAPESEEIEEDGGLVKIGLFLPLMNPLATPSFVRAFGRAAEDRGFDSLWVAEHVVLFDDYQSRYPYAPEGKIVGLPADSGILDPMVALGYVAAVTERIRLATGICLVPQRNPVYTAKEVATVDWLSDGRLSLGIGVGWLAEEFRALNVPFEHRGSRCREYIEVMKRLWSDPVSEFSGRFYDLPACRQYPKPVQQPHPPLLFGGESDAALRRVADLGVGWFGFDHTPETAAECIARLDGFLAKRGRPRSEVEIAVSPYLRPCDFDQVKRFREAGVDHFVLFAIPESTEAIAPRLDALAEQILEPARAL
jgi:probable F420-dependent oxidoreductase